jgi:RNA recognition motif-containing protein
MSIRLYIGNLPEELSRQELEAVFADAENPVSTKIITDRKTNKCRGFGFVTVKSDEQADELIEKFNGYMLKDNAIKIEKALPRSKEKGDEQPEGMVEAAPETPTARRKGGSSNSGSNGNKSRRSPSPQTESEGVQPDPRWAQELEKLKQLLAAQTTNS